MTNPKHLNTDFDLCTLVNTKGFYLNIKLIKPQMNPEELNIFRLVCNVFRPAGNSGN